MRMHPRLEAAVPFPVSFSRGKSLLCKPTETDSFWGNTLRRGPGWWPAPAGRQAKHDSSRKPRSGGFESPTFWSVNTRDAGEWPSREPQSSFRANNHRYFTGSGAGRISHCTWRRGGPRQ